MCDFFLCVKGAHMCGMMMGPQAISTSLYEASMRAGAGGAALPFRGHMQAPHYTHMHAPHYTQRHTPHTPPQPHTPAACAGGSDAHDAEEEIVHKAVQGLLALSSTSACSEAAAEAAAATAEADAETTKLLAEAGIYLSINVSSIYTRI